MKQSPTYNSSSVAICSPAFVAIFPAVVLAKNDREKEAVSIPSFSIIISSLQAVKAISKERQPMNIFLTFILFILPLLLFRNQLSYYPISSQDLSDPILYNSKSNHPLQTGYLPYDG